MMIYVKDKVYTENNMLSAIIGQHGKSPWDFEFVVPADFSNRFLEECLYTDIVIAGVDNTSISAPKQNFVITKIEQIVNETQSEYVVSGVGKAEYLLQTSIASWKLIYQPGETGVNFVNRVLRTFTGKVWLISQLGGGSPMNFPEIEKGQYLSDWFWNNFKKEKAICTVKALSEQDYFNLEIVGVEGVESKIISRFITKTRTWEKSFDMFYAMANDFLFKYKKTPTSSNPMPQVLRGTYAISANIFVSTFSVPDLEGALGRILRLEDASGRDLGLKVQAIVLDLDFRWSQRFFVFVQTKTITHTPGVRIRIKQDSPELLEKVRSLHLYRHPDADLGTGVIVDNSVWFSEWGSNSHSGPVVPNGGTTMYGIRISNEIGDLKRYGDTGEWFPSSFSFNIQQDVADLAAAGNIEFPELPDGHPHSDYEIFQDEFKRIDVGDEIVILGGDSAILTDKVISYENGEVHYDCTTKDLLEIEAKQ